MHKSTKRMMGVTLYIYCCPKIRVNNVFRKNNKTPAANVAGVFIIIF